MSFGLIREYVRYRFYARYRPGRFPYVNLSFSQHGEDMAIAALLADDQVRFYVDIGAHHPVLMSNTYHFYLRGWRGINVDAEPGSMAIFRWLRRYDKNIETAIGPTANAGADFFRFEQSAFNTFDSRRAAMLQSQGQRLHSVLRIPSITLTELLATYLPKDQQVSFLTIDTETCDADILASNDWNRFRPAVVAFESLDAGLSDINNDPTVSLLSSHGYGVAGKIGPTILMRMQ